MDFEIESLDNVKEEHKPLYRETEGKFRLDLEAYGEYVKKPVVAKNSELLGKQKKAQEQLTKLAKFQDVDDDTWNAFEDWKQHKANEGEGEGKGEAEGKGDDVAAMKAKFRAEAEAAFSRKAKDLQTQLVEKEKALADLQGKHSSFVADTKLTGLALKFDVMPDRLESFKKTVADRFRLDESGDLLVLDDDGDVSDVKPEKFIAETLREQYPFFYAAKEQGGSGTQQSSGASGSKSGLKKSAMTNEQKAKYIRDYGADAYNRLQN